MVRFASFLFALFLASFPLVAEAAKQVRAKPVLRNDEEYNALLIHIAQHFVLTVPEDRSMDDVKYDVRCSFEIGEDGSFGKLQIENDTDAWTGFFDGPAARSTELWLKNAVLQGMILVPRYDVTKLRSRRASRKRVIVFSFGKGRNSATDINSVGFNSEATRANLGRSLEEQREQLLASAQKGLDPADDRQLAPGEAERMLQFQAGQWTGFADKNMIETSKPKLNPYQQAPPMRLPQVGTPDTAPIEVTITLQ